MSFQERQLVLDQLASSETRLLQLVDGLTPQQWNFREKPERWSIAENIEHVIAFENFIMEVIARVMTGPAEPEKKTQAPAKEPFVLRIADDRERKFNAREVVRPVGRWPETAEMMAELRKTRARTVAFVTEALAVENQADLRSHFFAHVALGDLDCYQWLLVLAQHGSRHALQIEEIKADPAYPAK
jgi:DinB superfamily